MSIEDYEDPLLDCSTAEIARWLAKNARFHYAQQYAPIFFNEGWGESGHTAWILGKKCIENAVDYTQDPLYEEVVLYEMDGELLSVGRMLNLVKDKPQEEATTRQERLTQVARTVGFTALQDGYRRAGILKSAEASAAQPVISIGALAAGCFIRGDITEMIDRRLYDRQDDIKVMSQKIADQAKPRIVTHSLPSRSAEKYNIYGLTQIYAYKPERLSELLRLEEPAQSARAIWWSELQSDFAQIDVAIA